MADIQLGKVWLTLGVSTRGLSGDLNKLWKDVSSQASTEGAKAGAEFSKSAEKNAHPNLTDGFKKAADAASSEGKRAGGAFSSSAEDAGHLDLGKSFKDAAKAAGADGTKAGASFSEAVEAPTKGLKAKLSNAFRGITGGRAAGEKQGKEFDDGVQSKSSGSGLSLASAMKVGLVGLGAKLGLDFMGEFSAAVSGAANVEQSRGAIEAVFGGAAAFIQKEAKGAAASVGMSENSYNESAMMTGSMLMNSGMSDKQAGEETSKAMAWAADVSSMYGGAPEEAAAAFNSGLKGSFEMLERYGISITAASLEQQMLAMGMKKVNGEFTNAQKQQAMMAMVYDQSSAAQGNFAKEADTFSGKTVRMTAAMDNLKASIGEHFLPILSTIVDWFNSKVIPALDNLSGKMGGFASWISTTFGPVISTLKTWFQENADTVKILLTTVGAAALPFAIYSIAMGAASVASGIFATVTKGVTGAFKMLNIAMRANPILFIVSLIALLVGALVGLYQNNETFRNFINAIWAGIQNAVQVVANWFMNTLVPWFQAVWANISVGLSAIGAFFSTIWDGIKFAIAVAVAVITTIIQTHINIIVGIFNWLKALLLPIVMTIVNGIVGFFRALYNNTMIIFNAIKAFFGMIWTAIYNVIAPHLNTLKNLFFGAWNVIKTGVSTAFNAIKGVFSTVWGAIRDTVMGVVNPLKDSIIGAFNLVKSGVTTAIENLKSGLSTLWEGIKQVFKDPINAVIRFINDPFISNINEMLGKFGLGDKKMKPLREISMATGGVLPGYSPGRDIHEFYSPTGGKLNLSGGEAIMRPEWVRAVGGPRAIAHMNDAARHGQAFATGGIFQNPDAGISPRTLTTYQGKTFTTRFAQLLAKANKMGGGGMHISQGGFRPATSYSGTSHRGDAADITGNFRKFIIPLRQLGIAAWDRTGKGKWVPHVHAVPTPGRGFAAGSAVWQAQDYLRGGDGLGGRDNGPRIKAGEMGAVAGYSEDGSFIGDILGSVFDTFTAPVRAIKDGLLSGKGVIGDMLSGSIDSVLKGARDWITGFKFDNGGYLQPGSTLTVNKTRQPEAILTNSQWSAISTVAQRGMDQSESDQTVINIENISLPGIKHWDELAAFAESLPSARRKGQMIGG